MADKNIQMSQRNADNTGWDNLYPKSKAAIISTADGSNVETKVGLLAPKANPTFTGTAKATANTNYTTSQIRNAYFSTTIPGTLANGEICFVYE